MCFAGKAKMGGLDLPQNIEITKADICKFEGSGKSRVGERRRVVKLSG